MTLLHRWEALFFMLACTLYRCNCSSLTSSISDYMIFCDVYTGGTPQTHEHKTVAVELFITYSILSGMGIVFAVICLVFNLVFRKKM